MDDQYTNNDIIARYLQLRTYKDELEAKKKEVQKVMDTLEAVMLSRLTAQKEESIRSESGTAYRTTFTSVRTIDKPAFQAFVIQPANMGMLDARPDKEGVLAYLKQTNETPPGVSVTYLHNVNFRIS